MLMLPLAVLAKGIYVKDEHQDLVQPKLPPRSVVLTFDDGPSAYTPAILDILKQKHIKATFFVIGSQVIKHPLTDQIYKDSHEVGNHTYSHADLSKQPAWRMSLELNLNRIIIGSQINRSTRLFRPPLQELDALDPSTFSVVTQAADLGYITVGENIDSQDWRRPGVAQIIANVTNDSGGIILFHDGGGDRSQTVEALPKIIDYYQNRGYHFMTVSQALGVPQPEVMPPLSQTDHWLGLLALSIFSVGDWFSRGVYWFILSLIITSFGRMALVIIAALMQSRREYREDKTQTTPCSVIIPAYNEELVIQSCLQSVLSSCYSRFEVIVVDDGSSDKTSELASASDDHRLRIVIKPNGGKASALNYGIELARTNFVIAIDADTVFQPDTIGQLMRHFKNPQVGAVSGNTRIANRHKLLTKLQSLEYVVGFNLDRRMGDLLDCITVVPGAIGAFRKSALKKVGGFTTDTLAEDTDLTLAIKREGYRIVYDAVAVAYTEAPATVRELLKQRFRWTFGTMQAVWKHKKAVLNPRYGTLGLIGLPYLVFYQILLPLLSPIFDVAVIIGLINHQYQLVAVSFVVYTAADALTAAIALKLDGEKLRQLWLVMPQRIIYRQLMYYTIVRSVVNVLKGNLVGWGSLKREGKHLARVSSG
ncbi:MAG TPA: glycosyltransferase [Candidatus Saccharimonadales bacterium]|nr:glycosyltransferase [Candidatus Saccharimonadales bacterium]